MFIINFDNFKASDFFTLMTAVIILTLNILDKFTDFKTINTTYCSEYFLTILISS